MTEPTTPRQTPRPSAAGRPHAAAALALALAAGCGGDPGAEGRAETFATSGTIVTSAGAPVANANVAFAPREGQPTAFAKTDAQGRYRLTTYEFGDGAAAGEYKVVVTKSVIAAPEPAVGAVGAGGGHAIDEDAAYKARLEGKGSDRQDLLPEQYSSASTTPLSATVTPEDNVLDFQIGL